MKKYTVYIHKNKINNKIYVGQTCNDVNDRWNNGKGYKNNLLFYDDIKKYGWNNFDRIIVKTNLSNVEADCLEKDLINTYNLTNSDYGYNHTMGGKGLLGYNHTSETKRKISNSKIGVLHSEQHKKNIGKSVSGDKNYRSQKVNQYTLDGDYIKTWDYIKQAETELNLSHGAISACCRNIQKTAFGYIWRYAS